MFAQIKAALFPCMHAISDARDRQERALHDLKTACDDINCKIVSPPPFDERHIINRPRT